MPGGGGFQRIGRTWAAAAPADVSRVPRARLPRRPGRPRALCPDPNGHPSPGRFTCSRVRRHRDLLEVEPLPAGPSPLTAAMGGYLSSPQPPLPPLVQRHPNPGPGPAPAPAPDGAHGGRRVHPGPLAQGPAKPPPEAITGLDLPSCAGESYLKLGLGGAQHPRKSHSPVTIKIAPPERRGSPCASPGQSAHAVGPPRAEERPGPCAKETVLRALSLCRKGDRRSESPEGSSRARGPEPRPSAFKPLFNHGVAPSFVPRPGPLNARLPSPSYDICKGKTAPGPVIQPSRSAANHTAGTVPAQGTEPQLGSRRKRQREQDIDLSPSAQGAVGRVSFFVPEYDLPAGPCGC